VVVILCASIVSAQQYYVVDGQHYSYSRKPRGSLAAKTMPPSVIGVDCQPAPRYYYPQPQYYDYGTGLYISAGERAWLDRRTESVFTGKGPGAPL
jgi:hypothetical protein